MSFTAQAFWILKESLIKIGVFSHHSEAGEGPPAGLELAGSAHSVALALHLHVPLKQLGKSLD